MIAAIEACTNTTVEAVVGKPSIYTIEAILDRLGLTADRCIMTGDRLETDVQMALNAGMAGALVLTGATDEKALAASSIKPTYVLKTIGRLAADRTNIIVASVILSGLTLKPPLRREASEESRPHSTRPFARGSPRRKTRVNPAQGDTRTYRRQSPRACYQGENRVSDKLQAYHEGTTPIGNTNRLWPLYGAGLENLGQDGQPIEVPAPTYGPDELLIRHDAIGLCFSDTKVIKQGPNHPRIGRDMVKEPVVLGHEVSLTVVGVGENLRDAVQGR